MFVLVVSVIMSFASFFLSSERRTFNALKKKELKSTRQMLSETGRHPKRASERGRSSQAHPAPPLTLIDPSTRHSNSDSFLHTLMVASYVR